MSSTLDSYIKQVVPDPVYSPFYAETFQPNPTTNILELNREFVPQGVQLILVHSVIITIPSTVLANQHKLIDTYGQEILNFVEQVNFTGQYHLSWIINSGLLKLTLTNTVGSKLLVTAIYQTIQNKEKK